MSAATLCLVTGTAAATDYHVGNWHVIEAEDTGLPMATLTTQSYSVGALVLVCDEGAVVLRVDVKSETRPAFLHVRTDTGQTVDLPLDDDGAGSEANLTALQQLYTQAVGSSNFDPSRIEMSFRADTERGWTRYDMQGFNTVLGRVSVNCGSAPSAPDQVATAPPTPEPAAPRSKVAANYEDYCQRYARGENTEAICACLVDTIIRVAERDNPGVPRYADVVLTTIRAYREANITGSSPQFSVRMALVGYPGNPAADPIALISRSIDANDEAVAQCSPQ